MVALVKLFRMGELREEQILLLLALLRRNVCAACCSLNLKSADTPEEL